MDIHILKLSNEKWADDLLSSTDILSIHLGYFQMNGQVTYSTNIPIAYKPEYILLTAGNVEDICYLCHVEKYEYRGKDELFSPNEEVFRNNAPDKFKDNKNCSWLLLDSMEKVSTNFLEAMNIKNMLTNFIKERANHKIITINVK